MKKNNAFCYQWANTSTTGFAMIRIALHMLFGDRAKYLLLLCSLSFASLLITQQAAVFFGLMRWSTAILRNSNAKIWVVDPKVEQVNETKPMRQIELQRVRSVEGIKWAMPMSFSLIQARLPNGNFKNIQLFGLDDTTLAGAPKKVLQGDFLHLSQDSAVFIDTVGIEKLSEGYPHDIGIGDRFEINDKLARVVGICETERSFFGYPAVFTTYSRALEFRPKERRNLSFVICEPKAGYSIADVVSKIERETGLKAYTENAFFWSTTWWFFRNTGIPISFGTTVVLGFLVGTAVAGQTFFSFIIENLPNFGALKAMGASTAMLKRMLIAQSCIVGITGYGIGLGLSALFGYAVLGKGNPPFYLPGELLIVSFFAILFICTFSVLLGIRKLNSVDPAQVFRV